LLIKRFLEFIRLETTSALVLFLVMMLALLWANSPFQAAYKALIHTHLELDTGFYHLRTSLAHFVNEGLMTFFFLTVSLEIKRELCVGELNQVKKAILPACAALGGMLLPALFYLFFNKSQPLALTGWAIPTATDIAFSLGILSLLGHRVPVTFKIFLMALAIFDDLGAIIIIAVFYARDITWMPLFQASLLYLALIILNQMKRFYWPIFILLGFGLWALILKSGIHATLAGVLLAWVVPIQHPNKTRFSPLIFLEKKMHFLVSYGILPLFAFVNAGIPFPLTHLDSWFKPVALGVMSGLCLGKPLGILIFSWLAVKFGLAQLPKGMHFRDIFSLGMIAGIGFTMSLFIAGLAFETQGSDFTLDARLGILMGSFLSGMIGYYVLRFLRRSIKPI
jgi:NhaA family Na+:H+ antiporter